jgi:hypothetical protein
VNARQLGISWIHIARALGSVPATATAASNTTKKLYSKHLLALEQTVQPLPAPATAELPRPARAAQAGVRRNRQVRGYESEASSEDEGEWMPPAGEDLEEEEALLGAVSEGEPDEDADAEELNPGEAIFVLRDAIYGGDERAVRRLLRSTPGLINYVWPEARAA